MKRLLVLVLMVAMMTPTAMAQSNSQKTEEDLFAGHRIVGEKNVTAAIAMGKVPEEYAAFEKAGLTKYSSAFGVHIFASSDSPDDKILHATKVTAGYVDNDCNGMPDNLWVLSNMLSRHAAAVITTSPKQLSEIEGKLNDDPRYRYTLSQGTGGINLGFINKDGSINREVMQDNCLEEIWHLFCDTGFSAGYPDIFGGSPGSAVADCMDIARGGHFTEPPTDGPKRGYPKEAWYYYKDTTCSYSCMVTEYLYWGLTSLLGVQEFNTANRPASGKGESGEWAAYTPELMRTLDPGLTSLLIDPKYKMPKKAPDGRYTPKATPTISVKILEVKGK